MLYKMPAAVIEVMFIAGADINPDADRRGPAMGHVLGNDPDPVLEDRFVVHKGAMDREGYTASAKTSFHGDRSKQGLPGKKGSL